MNQNNRWVVVTGSSSGIGRETALELARRGWNVVVHCSRSAAKAERVQRDVENVNRETRLIRGDLSNAEAGPEMVAQAWHETGGVHAWVHLAGVDLLTGAYADLPFAEKLALALQIDLAGTLLCCRDAGRRMVAQGGGVVLTVGWDQAATGMEGDSGELFAAVKGGVMAFTRSLAKSLAPTVRVNCVAPGWIKTAWGDQASEIWQERVLRETPLDRWGAPLDVAQTVAFLVSDEAAFITGQTINVNGGVVTS